MKDVTIINMDNDADYNNLKNKNIYQICRQSLLTGGDAHNKAFTNIGLYRGNIVVMRRVYKKTVDITRSVRKELKQMLRHENILNFIGVSIYHGSVIIFTTYCARGSLEDVLANDDLHLDHMFISSLVSDILKGMIALHDSEIISHGNLRSSNCLIDSRWVCSVADFGLHEFKAGQEEPQKREMDLKRDLWKAPELLRDESAPKRGTQKGDVYSFGIVLYEIIGRKGPWSISTYTHEEIVRFVKQPERLHHGFFRPPLSQLDVPDYIRHCLRSCWEEDPDQRPDIRLVRMKLKELQAGLKPNIFDNMLSIMEKYAYNLEGLVQEHTTQLYEEKKKTDMLLNQMLPRSVAESLKRGEPVEAECFDCVTILFSDIVGFTELCSESTPFEVVGMLKSIISNYDVYKMPRYCLFGDTVNTASGMESSGEAMKIHISEQTYQLLENYGGYHCIERGLVNIKGKGGMRTYWLVRQNHDQINSPVNCNETTPDLISNVDVDSCPSNSGALNPITLTACHHKLVPQASIAGQQRWHLSRASYCKCATKWIYNRRSDDNVHDDVAMQRHHDMMCNKSHLCVCRLNSSILHSNSKTRGPRSAPVITFRL